MLYFGDSSTFPELSSTGSGCVGSSTSVTGPADTSLPELGVRSCGYTGGQRVQ